MRIWWFWISASSPVRVADKRLAVSLLLAHSDRSSAILVRQAVRARSDSRFAWINRLSDVRISAVLDSGVKSHLLLSHSEMGREGVLGEVPQLSVGFWKRVGGVFGGDARPGCIRFATCELESESTARDQYTPT